MSKKIHLLFGATSDYLPYAVVTTISAALKTNRNIIMHFMYADIVKSISNQDRNDSFSLATENLKNFGIEIKFYNVEKYIKLLEGQNVGMWGKEISMTHYIYLLAQEVIEEDKLIYLDTDMIVNSDLSRVFDIEMSNKLIAMAEPRGFEEMGNDVSNSGFVIINLSQWRKENTLQTLLAFGRQLPRGRFCDQNLLYQYFTKLNSNRVMLVDKEYNIFPQCFPEMSLDDIKILHYTGYNSVRPWDDISNKQRFSCLWWKYAKLTFFYEYFFFKCIHNKDDNKNNDNTTKKYCLRSIPLFSIRKNGKKKTINILGIKISYKKRK